MDKRTVNRASMLALCSCLAACGTDEKPDPTRVKLADGELQGSVQGTSLQFLGIPYAKPPVGDLRWKAPQKPDPWTTTRDATKFGKRCAQLADPTLQNAAKILLPIATRFWPMRDWRLASPRLPVMRRPESRKSRT